MAKRTVKFAFEAGEYTPFYAWVEPTRTEEEIIKEYSRLRSVARKRIGRLTQAGFITPEQQAQRMQMLPTVAQIRAKGQSKLAGQSLVYAYNVLAYGQTVTKARQRLADIAKNLGQEIAPAELDTFENFMRAWRLYHPDYVRSDRAANDYNTAYRDSEAPSAEAFWSNYETYTQQGGMYK